MPATDAFDLAAWPSAVAALVRDADRPVDALFDMDGTLLDGDIGDDMVAWLLQRGHHPDPFRSKAPDFDTYRRITRGWEHRWQTELCAQVLVGLTPEEVDGHARELLSAGLGFRRPVLGLALALQAAGHRVWILTGSAEHLARTVATAAGLDPERCIGVRLAQDPDSGRLTDRIVPPVSFGAGKVIAARTRVGRAPGLALGDSRTDLHILRSADVAVAVPPAEGPLAEAARALGIPLRLPADLGG